MLLSQSAATIIIIIATIIMDSSFVMHLIRLLCSFKSQTTLHPYENIHTYKNEPKKNVSHFSPLFLCTLNKFDLFSIVGMISVAVYLRSFRHWAFNFHVSVKKSNCDIRYYIRRIITCRRKEKKIFRSMWHQQNPVQFASTAECVRAYRFFISIEKLNCRKKSPLSIIWAK